MNNLLLTSLNFTFINLSNDIHLGKPSTSFSVYALATLVCLCFISPSTWAADITGNVENNSNARISLEHELQDIKKDILQINRDLFILEENLLFPSNTQTKIFLSTDVGQYFKLDSVTLKINDKPVANHLYTNRELTALNRGAIQRLHTENLASGKHEIVAVIVGSGPEGRDYRRAVSTEFEKGTGPKYLQLVITGDRVKQQPEFTFKDWE